MKKKFYDIYGKIKVNENEAFSFKSYKSAIHKFDGNIIFDESSEHSTFSSDISEILTLLPYKRGAASIKPGFFVAASYVTVRLLRENDLSFIEYIISLKRFFLTGVLVSFASFIPAVIYKFALSLIWVPLVLIFFWFFAFPVIYISIPDEFKEFIKKHVTYCENDKKI